MTRSLHDLSDDRLDAALRAADPARSHPAPDREQLLARILEAPARTAPDQRHAQRDDLAERRVRRETRPRWTAPVAAAAVALAAVGAFAVDAVTGSPEGPGGDLVLAAAATEATTSGRVEGSVEVREAPEVSGRGGWDFAFTYAGGDFRARIDEGERQVRAIGVGDTLFTSYEQTGPYAAGPRAGEDGTGPSLEDYLGVAAAGRPVDGLVSLLGQTDSVRAQQSPDGSTTYSGVIATEDLQEVGELPPGASYLAGASAAEAPESIRIDADVDASRLTSLTLRLQGPTSAGPMDIVVRTTYEAAPGVTSIAAPAAGQVLAEPTAEECRITSSGDGGTTESAGCADLLAPVDRFYVEHPDSRCVSVVASGVVGSGREFVQCLREEGHDEAAEAYASYLDAFERSGL